MREGDFEGVKHFKELDTWKIAHELTLLIYKWTKEFPDDERFGLVSQMRRAAISITSNIAEGFGRFHWADKRNFYITARASCSEVESQILVSTDLGMLTTKQLEEGTHLCKRVKQTLNGLIRKMNNPTTKQSSSRSRIPNSDS